MGLSTFLCYPIFVSIFGLALLHGGYTVLVLIKSFYVQLHIINVLFFQCTMYKFVTGVKPPKPKQSAEECKDIIVSTTPRKGNELLLHYGEKIGLG